MKLTLVRHTSVDVPKGICYGITDVPVSTEFRNEMEQIRQKLAEQKFYAVFSSTLRRCTLLAAALVKDQNIHQDDRLTELNFGDWELTSWDSIFESAAGKAWFADYANISCPNGESFAEQIERARAFLSDLENRSFASVLVVTHAGIIRAMMCLLQDKTPEEAFRIPVENGQIMTFNLEKSVG